MEEAILIGEYFKIYQLIQGGLALIVGKYCNISYLLLLLWLRYFDLLKIGPTLITFQLEIIK